MQGRIAWKFVLLLGAMSVLALIAVQASVGASATIVRGDQWAAVPTGQCLEPSDFAPYWMTGDLVGCWYTDTFEVIQANDNLGGKFKASGTEHFVGCLDTNGDGSCAGEAMGRFNTTFVFTAKFAPSGDEIHGRCHHPIVGGTGAFAGASGGISFKDIPSEGRFPYHGEIKL